MSQNNAPNQKRGTGTASGGSGGGDGSGGGRKRTGKNGRGTGYAGGKNDRRKREPYCGVCFKAGKEKSVYNSHWTRENSNPDSPVVCPLILSTVCGYCKETGHSIKYCEKRIRKNNRTQENTSVYSTGGDSGRLSKNSSRTSLASFDSVGADNYRGKSSRRQHRNQDNHPPRVVEVIEEKPRPHVPPPPSKWVSAVEDGDAMKPFPILDLSMVTKCTVNGNGRRKLDVWVPIPTTDNDSFAPIMPFPQFSGHANSTFPRKRIHDWADCDSDDSDDNRRYTPISMRDLNDVSPYRIPSSSSESSCNDNEVDPEYEGYLIEV